jgi:hypothetical protein
LVSGRIDCRSVYRIRRGSRGSAIEIRDLSIQESGAQDQGRDQSHAKSFSHKIKINADPPNVGLYVKAKRYVNNEKYKPLLTPLEPSDINRLKGTRMKEFGYDTDTSAAEATAQNGDVVLRAAREAFSPLALNIIKQFKLKDPGGLDNANDLMLCVLAALDEYHRGNAEHVEALLAKQNVRNEQEARLLDALSKFEAVAASTAVEFGRIDLALTRMEGIEQELSSLNTLAHKIRGTDAWSIALNFVGAAIYVLLGAVITLLAEHISG